MTICAVFGRVFFIVSSSASLLACPLSCVVVVQVGPEFDAPNLDGFWPDKSRIPALQQEALQFQAEAHWIAGAAFEIAGVTLSPGGVCTATVNVRARPDRAGC